MVEGHGSGKLGGPTWEILGAASWPGEGRPSSVLLSLPLGSDTKHLSWVPSRAAGPSAQWDED